jgi:DNA replication initiation complex subunit (GINS family)
MITYSELYEVLRKEKYSEQLQHLPSEFFSNVAEYLEDKKKMTQKESDSFSDAVVKIKKQYENAIAIIKELIMKREKKIVNLALVAAKTGVSKRDIENMLENEKELFETITKKIEETEKQFNDMIEHGENKKDLKNQLIRFTQDTSEITDLEGNRLGPFKESDVANLPSEISEVLIKAGQAVLIESE